MQCKSRCAGRASRARADITPPAVSALRFGQSSHLEARAEEIDVYSEAVDIFQLHNRRKRHFNISQAPESELGII